MFFLYHLKVGIIKLYAKTFSLKSVIGRYFHKNA